MSHPVPPPPISAPPPRSSTAPHHQPHHSHHIHRPHRSHHHRHHHRDKSVPQSAIVPTSTNPFKADSSLGDLLSPITSRLHEGGRHETGDAPAVGRRTEDEEALAKQEKERSERSRRTWQEVERRRRARGEGDAALNATLTRLSALSTTQTRRLDYTHYSLLSHLSSLLSTLALLSHLSATTGTRLSSFSTTTARTARSASAQLVQLEGATFAKMKGRAEGLERRVKAARGRVRGLEARVEGVREGVEREEGEEMARERGRVWRWRCVLGALVGMVGLLVLAGWVRPVGQGLEEQKGGFGLKKGVEGMGGGDVMRGMEERNGTVMGEGNVANGAEWKTAQARTADGWEPRLRMLEDL